MNQIIGKLIKGKPVHIWGAGVSGLILGYYLKKAGHRVYLYEKENRVGGKIGTTLTEFGPIENGANALFLSPDALELLDELKLAPLPSALKLKRHLFINGKFTSPLSLSLILKIIFGRNKKTPQLSNPTVEDYLLPLLGQELIDHLVSPSLGGIYATEARGLDMQSLFPEEFSAKTYGEFIKRIRLRLKKNRGMRISGSVSFKGGMQIFINALSDSLKDEIKLNYNEPFHLQENTVITADAITAGELLKETPFASHLKSIQYAKLSTTTLFLKEKIAPLKQSFGVLIPRDQKIHSIGVLSNKDIFSANYSQYPSYTFITPEVDDLNAKIMSDLQVLAPNIKKSDFLFMESKLYPAALPVYNKERREAIESMHELSQTNSNIILFGNYVAGISLREMITAAKNFSLT